MLDQPKSAHLRDNTRLVDNTTDTRECAALFISATCGRVQSPEKQQRRDRPTKDTVIISGPEIWGRLVCVLHAPRISF